MGQRGGRNADIWEKKVREEGKIGGKRGKEGGYIDRTKRGRKEREGGSSQKGAQITRREG